MAYVGQHHAAQMPAAVAPRLDFDVRDLALEAIPPPSASMVCRMLSTIVTSRNVPMCGLAT